MKRWLYNRNTMLGVSCAIFLFAVAGRYYFSLGGPEGAGVFFNIIVPFYDLAAAVFLYMAAFSFQRREPLRKTWMLLATGAASYFIGDVNWLLWSIFSDNIPFPSSADVFYFTGLIILCCALYSSYRNHVARLLPKELIILSGSALVLIGLVAYYQLIPIYSSSEVTFIEKLLNLSYPTIDTVLLILSVSVLLLFGKGRLGLPWLIITTSFMTFSVTDMIYGYMTWHNTFQEDSLLNLGWIAAYILMMDAGWVKLSILNSLHPQDNLEPTLTDASGREQVQELVGIST